jgi:transposase, IS5 family
MSDRLEQKECLRRRISVIKRRHVLSRCRYKGDAGMKRWVGLGVIADNVINIGHAMEKQSHT